MMPTDLTTYLHSIIEQFQLVGKALACVHYGNGHIHHTYRLACQDGDTLRYSILQQINQHVFTNPEGLIENMAAVTTHLRQKVCMQGGDPLRRVVTLIPTWDGKYFYRTPQGSFWRAEVFIQGAQTYLQAQSPLHVYQAARAFGDFLRDLSDFPPEQLHVTIPHFHHTPRRFQAFLQAIAQNPRQRVQVVHTEIEFALQRAGEVSKLVDFVAAGRMPERVTHNDTKLDNVMIDDDTGEGICVIDLDTVMPGLAVFDFGDIVRSCCNPAREDERDLTRVSFDLQTFDFLAHGFLDATRTCLAPIEIDHLALGAKLLTFEQGLRFLTDYLNGDVYYPIDRPTHNLDRARTQFKLVQEMEAVFANMQHTIAQYR